MRTVVAPDAGETVLQVAAIHELVQTSGMIGRRKP